MISELLFNEANERYKKLKIYKILFFISLIINLVIIVYIPIKYYLINDQIK